MLNIYSSMFHVAYGFHGGCIGGWRYICLIVLFAMHGTAGLIYRLGKKKVEKINLLMLQKRFEILD